MEYIIIFGMMGTCAT